MPPTKLPAAVQRQIEATEQMDAEIAEALAPAPAPPAPPSDDLPPTPPAVAPPAAAPTEETWQHKYLSLQGKFNTEVPALRQQVTELTEQVRKLTATPSATPEPAPPAPAPVAAKLVTEHDVETFGADLVDLIRRAAREESEPEKAKLLAEIAELKAGRQTLEQRVETVTDMTVDARRQTYFAELGKLVADYVDINVDEAFKGWLTELDPMSGTKRNDILQSAFNAFDHARTAVIFNAFKQDTGRVTPPPAAAPSPPPAAEGLEAQLSPAGSKSTTIITADDGTKVWTAAEVGEFYTAQTRGDYRGNDAEARRIDASIDKAVSEGRVRP